MTKNQDYIKSSLCASSHPALGTAQHMYNNSLYCLNKLQHKHNGKYIRNNCLKPDRFINNIRKPLNHYISNAWATHPRATQQ